jgi:hypothetical protein
MGDHQIQESKSTKLLGMMIDNDQKWKSHFVENVDFYQH